MMIFRLWQNALLDKVQAPDLFFLAFDASAGCATACRLSLGIEADVKMWETATNTGFLNYCYFPRLNIDIYSGNAGGRKQSSVAVMHI